MLPRKRVQHFAKKKLEFRGVSQLENNNSSHPLGKGREMLLPVKNELHRRILLRSVVFGGGAQTGHVSRAYAGKTKSFVYIRGYGMVRCMGIWNRRWFESGKLGPAWGGKSGKTKSLAWGDKVKTTLKE